MAKSLRNRIYRKASDEEQRRHDAIRRQVEAELPEIKERARRHLDAAVANGVLIRHVVAALKAERERQGLSLADLKERTGIEKSTLSRLENDETANHTVQTLSRYAGAVGKQLRVILTDADKQAP